MGDTDVIVDVGNTDVVNGTTVETGAITVGWPTTILDPWRMEVRGGDKCTLDTDGDVLTTWVGDNAILLLTIGASDMRYCCDAYTSIGDWYVVVVVSFL